MNRSEEELVRYDIFKGSVLALLLICCGFTYTRGTKAAKSKELEMGLSMVEPPSADWVITTEDVRFSGSSAGTTVSLITDMKHITSTKINNFSWSMTVKAREIAGHELYLVAYDGKTKIDESPAMRFTFDDDLLAKIQKEIDEGPSLPVEIMEPATGAELLDQQVAFFGTGAPNAELKIFFKNITNSNPDDVTGERLENSVVVDDKGDWQFVRKFEPGKYRLTAKTKTHSSTIDFSVVKSAGGFTEN